jgi:hypothetical protein
MQDLNDFIFSLIRNPDFAEKVNDIVFESGNSLYQCNSRIWHRAADSTRSLEMHGADVEFLSAIATCLARP